jgi:dipeptidyl aminopeptidase/acylaminoacyl peptidase
MGALRPEQELAWEGVDFDTLLSEAFGEGALLAVGLHATPRGRTSELYLLTRTQTVPLLPFVVSDSARYFEWGVEPAPNGERIAYESNDGGFRSIFALGRTGVHDVSNHAAADWNPVWSPDSTRLAIESLRGGRRGVYRVYPETARVTPVAVSADAECWAPTWSPDGAWVAYVSDAGGAPDLYLRDEEGGRERRLTGGGGVAYAPAWRPAPGEDR